ncbi:MAG: hypothetical protein Gaeavirus9_3 [Gaeavirus sp.]|uniref:Uncharacterized protein n=1 Tax=Gaeavirus sp. TaxID=2487767 RepID=A0A3G5A2P0_9VIRU|nr:MAG: hypothetical protein Gaeavirus9_3 [Gaeavirus sp.]
MIVALCTGASVLECIDYKNITNIHLCNDFTEDDDYNADIAINTVFEKLHKFVDLEELHFSEMTLNDKNFKCISSLNIDRLTFNCCIFDIRRAINFPKNVNDLELDNNEIIRKRVTFNWHSLTGLEKLYIFDHSEKPAINRSDIHKIMLLTTIKNIRTANIEIDNELFINICNNLINLEELCLADDNFTKIPCEISKLTKLKSLIISGAPLISLPKEIGDMLNLTRLIIDIQYYGEDTIFGLPLNIMNLNLIELRIDANFEINIPNEYAALKHIETFSCDNNERNMLRWGTNVIVFLYDADTKIDNGVTRVCIESVERQNLDNFPMSLEELVINELRIPLTNLPPGLKKLTLIEYYDPLELTRTKFPEIPKKELSDMPEIKLPFGCELVIKNIPYTMTMTM